MKDPLDLFRFFEKIQYSLGEDSVRYLEVSDHTTFDFSPDKAMFSISYTVRKTFQRLSTTPQSFDDAICIYFKNVGQYKSSVPNTLNFMEKPVVHIFPYSAKWTSTFKKDEKVQVLCMIVRIRLLRELLGKDGEAFNFILNNYQHFLIEEILTDDILRCVMEIVHTRPQALLTDFQYRILAYQLIFHLFKSLSSRSQTKFQKMSNGDIAAIYKVKDALMKDLSKPVTIENLSKIAGMNINKMRKLFIQIFGMGIYEYFQKQRMEEAARRLKNEQSYVSEVGYEMGFENLSHFTRMFEK